MFLKSLNISSPTKVIRNIPFHSGLNLIVDENTHSTPLEDNTITGNSVGKTTVLRLIDYCLGGKANKIYSDPENQKSVNKTVKEFLVNNKIIITLTLTKDLEKNEDDIIIKRNFLSRKESINTINGTDIEKSSFNDKIGDFIFTNHKLNRPTFRQIISHNMRCEENSISHTLKTLNGFTTDIEYEALFLFMFGCPFKDGKKKQELSKAITAEKKFIKERLGSEPENLYEVKLKNVEEQIKFKEAEKSKLNINENYATDLKKLDHLKYQSNILQSQISALILRKNIIIEAKNDFEAKTSSIDTSQLRNIYEQAAVYISKMQKRFEDLVIYHNEMLEEKIKFLTHDLPELKETITNKNNELTELFEKEKVLSHKITQSNTYEELESLIKDLNDLFRNKGIYETLIDQAKKSNLTLKKLQDQLNGIDDVLFSENFKSLVTKQLSKFNERFKEISNELYNEDYAVYFNIKKNKDGNPIYDFHTDNLNHSTGKKQGEITCFDIAYILFAEQEKIPCLHFILNDKKELMDDNQLVEIKNIVDNKNIQFIASILKDKLPNELNKEKNFVLKLSQDEKLFRIENNQ